MTSPPEKRTERITKICSILSMQSLSLPQVDKFGAMKQIAPAGLNKPEA
eukprot:CAMPEP_0203658714 /NCGR_PEP_ID=MMETSP0088-20131115/49172_1 /ASSEMBLY_ACC=CAM_ASM_001087 /TAXON_ID=426623 /ORGANISM="Chaetoceros affinis, Strain CCMP159" /LENGTH=48 /DNA_ID= /DNA_START= /DNA_END= /DNA_ORIENTATION=